MSNQTKGTGQRRLTLARHAPPMTESSITCTVCSAVWHNPISLGRVMRAGWTLGQHHGLGVCPECMDEAMQEADWDRNEQLLIQESYK